MDYKQFTEEELQKNRFEYLKSAITADLIKIISQEENLSIKKSFIKFYSSPLAEKLENKRTGLYLESPSYLYELYKNENQNLS